MNPGPVDGGGAPRGGGDEVQQEQDFRLRVERHPANVYFKVSAYHQCILDLTRSS